MPSAINSNSGFQPQQSTIKLSGSSAISIQNLANFDALEIQGQVFLDGSSSDYRASVKVSVIKNGAGAYEVVATDIAGDDYLGSPICSFSVADSYLQITLDASLVAAESPALASSYIKFNIDTPSPLLAGSSGLAVDGADVVSGTLDAARLPITLDSGTYTPILTGAANIAANGLTAFECGYMRVGNYVQVSGILNLDVISSGVDTSFSVSVPISTTASLPSGGVAAASANNDTFRIYAVADNAITFRGEPITATNSTYSFIFSYYIA